MPSEDAGLIWLEQRYLLASERHRSLSWCLPYKLLHTLVVNVIVLHPWLTSPHWSRALHRSCCAQLTGKVASLLKCSSADAHDHHDNRYDNDILWCEADQQQLVW
jgi:hypothetical protein